MKQSTNFQICRLLHNWGMFARITAVDLSGSMTVGREQAELEEAS